MRFKKGDRLICLHMEERFDLHVGGVYLAAGDSFVHGESEFVELEQNDSGVPHTNWYVYRFVLLK